MSRAIGPKTRHARRFGVSIQPKDEKILTKRNYPPGMHGQKRQRVSQFGSQLMEKQKAKWTYGIMERQFRRYYEKAAKKPGQTGEMLIKFLESRLDNTVYRAGFASTRPQARQLVSHGFFMVNDKPVNVPSYEIKPGDAVSVKESKKTSKYIKTQLALMAKYKAPEWLSLDLKNASVKVLSYPAVEASDRSINTRMIVEFYSR